MRKRPEPEEPLDAAEVRRRQHGQVGAPVAVEEVEDVVPPRLRAGAERRPRHGRHRRERRPQSPVAARRPRASLKFGSRPCSMNRSVSAGSWPSRPTMTSRRMQGARRLAAAQPPPEHAERPEQQGHHRGDGGGEEHEERREQREARAGPDVRLRRLRGWRGAPPTGWSPRTRCPGGDGCRVLDPVVCAWT